MWFLSYPGVDSGFSEGGEGGGGGGTPWQRELLATTLARKVIMYVRAPQVHVVIRAAPCREQSGDETI